MSSASLRQAVAGLIATALLLTSCGEIRGERIVSGAATSGDATDELVDDADRRATDPATPGAVEVDTVSGNDAFAFASTELSTGSAVLGLDLVEDGPVVMTFLVPQCPVCIVAGPDLAASAAANPDITYIFVHSGGSASSYEDYIERSGLDGHRLENVVHLDDSPGMLWARFGVIQQPTNVLIDADGTVGQALGALSPADLEEVTAELAAA